MDVKRALIVACAAATLASPAAARMSRPLMGALMLNLQAKVNAACACTVIGVAGSVDRYPDRSDWRIDWRGGETDAQKAAGQAALDAFNPNDPANQ